LSFEKGFIVTIHIPGILPWFETKGCNNPPLAGIAKGNPSEGRAKMTNQLFKKCDLMNRHYLAGELKLRKDEIFI
jgi:hypothetical protein